MVFCAGIMPVHENVQHVSSLFFITGDGKVIVSIYNIRIMGENGTESL